MLFRALVVVTGLAVLVIVAASCAATGLQPQVRPDLVLVPEPETRHPFMFCITEEGARWTRPLRVTVRNRGGKTSSGREQRVTVNFTVWTGESYGLGDPVTQDLGPLPPGGSETLQFPPIPSTCRGSGGDCNFRITLAEGPPAARRVLDTAIGICIG
jgi:hypothetical protein